MDAKTTNLTLFLVGIIALALFLWYFATERENRKKWVGTILSLLMVVAGTYWLKTRPLQKGIDLQGGVAYTVSVVPNDDQPVSDADVEAAKGILERRLSPLGNKDVNITPLRSAGTPKLYVEVPGITPEEAEKNKEIIEKTAKLDLRLLHEQSDSLIEARAETDKVLEPGYVEIPDLQKVAPRIDPKDGAALKKRQDEKILLALENKGVSSEAQAEKRTTKIYKEKQTIVVQKIPELAGKSVKRAVAWPEQQSANWEIHVELHGEYGDKMRAITKANNGKPLGIVVDGELISSPRINGEFGANFQVSGNFTQQEAEELASMLENPLENPLRIDQTSNTSATYGENLINQGLRAGLIGLAATLLFMAFYYKLAGVVAVIGLAVNLLLLMAAMNIFEFTLTMPGIAGIILTLGIAVDANVLIYERMREEFDTGKDLDTTLNTSYSKAFTAIFDSNLTSLITSVIMIVVATGAIRGFGVTLTIGILASLFTSLLITRVLFRWLLQSGVKKMSFRSLVENRYIDFLGVRKKALMASLIVCVASAAVIGIKGEKSLGYELRGGDLLAISGVTETEVTSAITGITATTQVVKPLGGGTEEVNIRANFGDGQKIKEALVKAYPDKAKIGDVQSVGPAVGGEMLGKAIWAIVLGLVGIFIYLVIRYETPFAIGGIVAIFHDVLISAGFCVLFGKEIGMILIGAFLTIAGYSINDTIVIFDRIREQLKNPEATSLSRVMNEAISATLSRTIITSGVTLLVVISMLVLGGSTLADFSLAMLLGMIVGTYSTIFIASPIVYWWAQKRKLNLAAHIQEAELLRQTIGSGLEREVNPNEIVEEEPPVAALEEGPEKK